MAGAQSPFYVESTYDAAMDKFRDSWSEKDTLWALAKERVLETRRSYYLQACAVEHRISCKQGQLLGNVRQRR